MKLKPIYKSKTFKSEKEFNKWLKETTFKEIIFSGHQDLIRMHIAESGEILHCNAHARMYNGCFVNMERLEDFSPIEILEDGKWVRKMGLLVEEIIEIS